MKTQNALEINLYPPDVQAEGAFDGERITEIKPLGFPHEGPTVPHVGPLFYWAWATAKGYGKIGLHPHAGFEIMSYALQGEIGHYDTMGNRSRVKAGGAQIMQTGSGVSHEEETLGDHTEFFQIWFEPDLEAAFKRSPTYQELSHENFPRDVREGVGIKSIIGERAPITLVTEATMQDVTIEPNFQYQRALGAGKTLALVVISGEGRGIDEASGQKIYLQEKSFAVVHAKEEGIFSLKGEGDSPLRLAVIEVPAQVNYPLYKEKPRFR
jgi:redox-sensitive bicupin YhaK (pirin superfamily)